MYRRIKVFYELYNLVNFKRLRYQKFLYEKFGVRKNFFQSIQSKDFPKDQLEDHPWLDRVNSKQELPIHPSFQILSNNIQNEILYWSDRGCAVLRRFFSEEKVEEINELILSLTLSKKLKIRDGRKIMFAVRHSEKLKNLVCPPGLQSILELLMGREIELFQSVNFFKGSEDPAHSDFIHMSTYPFGYLTAAWIALEDIDETNGPLFYFPGSHKSSYIMNDNFDSGAGRWLLGKHAKSKYSEKVTELISENNFQKELFIAKKGDVLIWHANLIHGGSKMLDNNRTRKSMVLHFYGKDVVRYHEITQRPTLSIK
jgi:hypothetical protein